MKEPRMEQVATLLTEIGRAFYSRGWALGTSGNFSAVVGRDPLVLAMSPSGADKGSMSADLILLIDEPIQSGAQRFQIFTHPKADLTLKAMRC